MKVNIRHLIDNGDFVKFDIFLDHYILECNICKSKIKIEVVE